MFGKSQASKDISSILLYAGGLTSASAFIYMAGPYVVIGDWRPLENYIIRDIVIVLLTAVIVSVAGFSWWRRRKSAAALEKGVEGEGKAEDDGEELSGRMKDALATLKKTSGRSDFLYDLPWYVIIGPPGSGKTTALVNSGLKFPLSEGATPAAVAGLSGTRYCDWWFTEDAVLIDTAGRYTTQDSDAKSDQKSWFGFLDLLKKNRPRQPINGVIVAISLHDVLTLPPAELAAHSKAIRARLIELHDRLKIDFPVYALFTKGDLVAGFMEYFGHLSEEGRRKVWGATFQSKDKKKNLVSEVPKEFDDVIQRLNEEMPDRLQEEPAPATRVSLYGFPAQMAALKRPLHDFLNAIFEPTRYHANATLRGFYFTSGTQHGSPVDQLIMALVKNFGAEEVSGAAYSGLGKSFFLTDLIQKVIIGEASWVTTDPKAVRRALIFKALALSLIFGIAASFGLAWYTSYSRNQQMLELAHNNVTEYRASAGTLPTDEVVADSDLARVLPLLDKLRALPAGYASKDEAVAYAATFGLGQTERLAVAGKITYRVALERMFRPRILLRLEEVLDAKRNDVSFVYEALKVYMMLGGLHAVDREFAVSWIKQDWADNLFAGVSPGQVEGRRRLEEHLNSMLDLEPGHEPLVATSATLLRDSQTVLARLSVSQRAYQLLKSQTRALNLPDWQAARAGGGDFERVFEGVNGAALDTVRVPAFFTYAGFQRGFIDKLAGIRERIEKEKWVLGEVGEQASVADQYKTLSDDLLDLYTKEFIAAWPAALGKLQMKNLAGDKPKYLILGAASAAASPIKSLLESIRDETALTKERAGFKKAEAGAPATPLANTAAPAAPAPAPASPGFSEQIGQPGAKIEAQFRPFHAWVDGDGSRREIDQLVGKLAEIKDQLLLSATVPTQAAEANTKLLTLLPAFVSQAQRLPAPFNTMLLKSASTFSGDVDASERAQITKALGDQVTGFCTSMVQGKYPFFSVPDREIPLADFGKLFGPGQIMDGFFKATLAKYADISKPEWRWRQDISLSRTLSQTTLKSFQQAAQIRDTFFSTGGNLPSVNMQVIPPVISGVGVTARFDVNGAAVVSQSNTSVTPGAIQWPGASAGGRTAITLTTEAPPPQQPVFAPGLLPGQPPPPAPPPQPLPPSVLEKTGPWSLFRMIDRSGATQRGDRLIVSFIVGGRELTYQIAVGSTLNPFTMSALREFRCPNGF